MEKTSLYNCRMTKIGREILRAERLCCGRTDENGSRATLTDVNFSLSSGEVALLRGPSGSGKTTLLWTLAQMIEPISGEIYLNGRPFSETPDREWRARTGLVIQKCAMIAGNVRDNLLLGYRMRIRRGSPSPADTVLRAELDTLGLADVSLDDSAANLSTGQTARVAFIRTLISKPDALLLDETTAGLDSSAAALFEKRALDFAAGGGCVLAISHSGEIFKSARRFEVSLDGKLTEPE